MSVFQTVGILLYYILMSVDVPASCEQSVYEDALYTVCAFDRDEAGMGLALYEEDGRPYGHFSALALALSEEDRTLKFAMNAGMYHEDRSPVGLYIEDDDELAPLQTGSGTGNFHLLPNGVFFWGDDGAAVFETEAYAASAHAPKFATQSGPMLVIDGELHPVFSPDSTSFKRRNGVGINRERNRVYFVMSEGFVSFHQFASVFKDELGTDNALYLDGTISRLYSTELSRNDVGRVMGPIVYVTD